MDCKHENRKLIDYTFSGFHMSTFKCQDCKKIFDELDGPIIYSYPPKIEIFKGVQLHKEDIEILKRKYEEVERNKVGD